MLYFRADGHEARAADYLFAFTASASQHSAMPCPWPSARHAISRNEPCASKNAYPEIHDNTTTAITAGRSSRTATATRAHADRFFAFSALHIWLAKRASPPAFHDILDGRAIYTVYLFLHAEYGTSGFPSHEIVSYAARR